MEGEGVVGGGVVRGKVVRGKVVEGEGGWWEWLLIRSVFF